MLLYQLQLLQARKKNIPNIKLSLIVIWEQHREKSESMITIHNYSQGNALSVITLNIQKSLFQYNKLDVGVLDDSCGQQTSH